MSAKHEYNNNCQEKILLIGYRKMKEKGGYAMMNGLIPFDGLFGDAALDDFFGTPSRQKMRFMPKVDIEGYSDRYEVVMDVPGFTKDEVEITYEKGILTIGAKKAKKVNEEEHHYIRRERASYSFQRQFSVKDIEESGISASLKDGVLRVRLPKKDIHAPGKAHRIEIG